MSTMRKKNVKKSKPLAPGLSRRAEKLLERRRQRFYGSLGKERNERRGTTLLTYSATRVSAMEDHTTDASALLPVSISLLGTITLTLHTPDGLSKIVPLRHNVQYLQLLAFLAWMRGKAVQRDIILEKIFGAGPGAEATTDKQGRAFGDYKKLIRLDIRRAVAQLNKEQGEMLLDPALLDIFVYQDKMWSLSPICRVIDLELVDREHQIIAEAEKQGLLYGVIPVHIREACDRLITAYKGDFLEDLVSAYSKELRPWVRGPYTLYRDYYLKATRYIAEYELQESQHYAERRRQLQHWWRAAEHYKTYALFACNSRYDLKVTFGLDGRPHGERVVMAESALRLSVALHGAIGRTDLADELYSAYYRHMRKISDKWWEPSEETLRAVQAAKNQSDAYQFLAQVTRIGPIQNN